MIVLKEYEFEKNMRENILKYEGHNSVNIFTHRVVI
jgi:hypothetical protein